MSNDIQVFNELKSQITAFVAPTSDLIVTDSGTNIMAQGVLKTLTEFEKQVEQTRVALKKPLLDAQREIESYAKSISEPLEIAKASVKTKMLAWANLEAKRRADEQMKINHERMLAEKAAQAAREAQEAEARKIREAEAKALKDKQDAERKVFEAEQKKKQDALKLFGIDQAQEKAKAEAHSRALREKAEMDKMVLERKAEQERVESQAKFDREQAEAVLAAKQKELQLEASRPKNTRVIKKWRTTNEDLIPDQYWMVDEQRISTHVKMGAKTIPGIEIYEETIVVAR